MAPAKAPAVKLKYTNRKSEGTKLASIVAKDLRKHSSVLDKKLEKGKEVTDNDSASLELDLESKEQNDDCIEAFVNELQEALRARDGVTPLRLEELTLRNNGLTARSLRLLAPIIEAARFDIRDVDVSQNQIRVTTREEAADFEAFLKAFRDCELMRRLDLSGNDFSGPLAMEVFLRVYCEHPPVDSSLLYYQSGPGSRDAEYDMLSERTNNIRLSPNGRKDETSEDIASSVGSLTTFRYLRRCRGLRAIPYILLRNAKLDDAGALHLSYVLERHYWPQYLMTKLKEGSREAKRKEEDDSEGCFGLIRSGNAALSQTGVKVLEHANAARAELVGANLVAQTPQSSWVDAVKVRTLSTKSRKLSFQSESSDRRVSGSASSIDSLRKRLQRTTIESQGVQAVQLWHAAFKVMYAARVILPPSKEESNSVETSRQASPKLPSEPLPTSEEGSNRADTPTPPDFARRAMKLAKDPQSLLKPTANGQSDSGSKKSRPKIDKSFERDMANPEGLPTRLWGQIFRDNADAEEVLNDEQVARIVEYARDRSNIEDERHNHAKGDSHELWHVLEEVDCFTYELKMASA